MSCASTSHALRQQTLAFRIDERSTVTSWALAALVALATGLSTLYFKGTSWGSFQDYVTMFLWGVGVDQGLAFTRLGAPFTCTRLAGIRDW